MMPERVISVTPIPTLEMVGDAGYPQYRMAVRVRAPSDVAEYVRSSPVGVVVYCLWAAAFRATQEQETKKVKPIEFPEQTQVWAKDQPPYLPLPAYTNERETISLWALTWRERLKVLLTGRLWLRQMNFGGALQPQAPTVDRPFVETP